MFGAGDDLQIYHNSNHSIINNSTGDLRLESDRIELLNNASNEFLLTADANGAVELYHNNLKKIETIGYGVTVTGITSTTNLTVSDTSDFVGQINADGNIKVPGLADNQVLHASSTGTIEGNNNLTFDGSSLQVTGVTTTSDLFVTGVGTVTTLVATSASSDSLTVDNVRIDGNTVDSTSGNLILDSVGNVTVSSDLIVTGLATVNQGHIQIQIRVQILVMVLEDLVLYTLMILLLELLMIM